MTNIEKKQIYNDIINDVARLVKSRLNEDNQTDFFGPVNFKGPDKDELTKIISDYSSKTVELVKNDFKKATLIGTIYQNIFTLLKNDKLDVLNKLQGSLMSIVGNKKQS